MRASFFARLSILLLALGLNLVLTAQAIAYSVPVKVSVTTYTKTTTTTTTSTTTIKETGSSYTSTSVTTSTESAGGMGTNSSTSNTNTNTWETGSTTTTTTVSISYSSSTTTFDVSVEIDGDPPTTEDEKKEDLEELKGKVAEELNKKAVELDNTLKDSPDLLDADDIKIDADRLEDGKVDATTSAEKEKVNAVLSQDPVRFSTGKLVTTDNDLSLRIDGLDLSLDRHNSNGEVFPGSLGSHWSFSLDSRVVWGRNALATEYVADLTSRSRELWKAYNTAKAELAAYVGDLDAKEAAILTELAELRRDRASRVSAQTSASYPEVKAKIQESIDSIDRVIQADEQLLSTVRANRTSIKTQFDGKLAALKTDIEDLDDVLAEATRQCDRANEQTARDALVWKQGDPLNWLEVGNDKLVLIDESGTGRVLSLTPGTWSASAKYSDGTTNWYPSGSSATGLEGTGDSFGLQSDGSLVWTRKNGEQFLYSRNGQLVRRQDTHGNGLTYEYDGRFLTKITDKRGRVVLTLGRDTAHDGRLTNLTDVSGRVVEYGYDASGRLFSVKDTSGDTIQYFYDGSDRLTQIRKPDQSSRNYVYDLISGKVSSDADEENKSEFFEYLTDAQGKPYTRYTDASGVWEKHFYDPVKFFDTRVEYANGTSVVYEYDDFDRVKKETWNSGRYRTFTYDASANLLNRRNLDGTTESWIYTVKNVLSSYTDPRGYTTTFSSTGYDITGVDYPGSDDESYTYRLDGTLNTQTNAKNGVRSYDYDAGGFVSKITYSGGASAFDEQFVNDALGRVVSYQDAAGVKTYYRYRADGSVQSVIYPDGRAKVLTYNNRKDKTREETRRYTGLNGDQVAALPESLFGSTQKFEVLDFSSFVYDKRHKVTRVTNSLGQLVRYTYDGAGKVLTKELVDEKGVSYSLTALVYDAGGQLASTSITGKGINQAVTHQYRYDDQGRLAREQDERGVWSQYAFDSTTGNVSGRAVLVDGTNPDTGSWKTLTSLSYAQGRVTGSEDYKGTVRQFGYDNRGRLNKVEARWQGQWTTVQELSFDGSGGVAERIEGGKTKTQWDYDVWGNTVAERNALALKEGRSASKRLEYDGRGLVTKATDDAGLVTEYTWDALRRLKNVVEKDASGAILSTMAWDYKFVNKRLNVEETDKRGTKRTRVYDALSRVVEEINGYGKSRLYQYNVLGQVTKVTDETGRFTTLDYDGLGRQLSQRQGGQVVGFYTYDGAGKLLSTTDGEGRATTYQYDRLGRLTSEKQGVTNQGAALTTSYTYNDDSHTVVRATGTFTHTYSYDEWARLSSETDAANKVQSYTYDSADNLTAKTDYKGQNWSYGYNALNQTELVTVNGKSNGSYQYDRMGRLTSALGPDAKAWYQYDVRGNLTRQEDDTGAVYTYGYDAGGLRTSRQRDDKSPTKYTWGKEGELTTLEDSAHNQSFFSYDEAGREIQVVETNGMTRQTQYDDVGRVSFIREVKTESSDRNRRWDDDGNDWGHGFFGYRGWGRGHRTPVWGEAYAYDDSGKVSLKANLNGDVTLFDYDEAGRLEQSRYSYGTSGRWEVFEKELKRYKLNSHNDHDKYSSKSLKNTVKQLLGDVYYEMGGLSSVRWDSKLWTENYDYDTAGNRSQVSATRGDIDYTYDANNRLTKAGNRSYTYDANGNQLTETVGGETVTMGYTADNRIKSYDRVWAAGQVADDPEAEDETPHKVSYTYDPLGRRSSKTQRGHEGTKTQEYQYEGLGLDLIRIADAQQLTASTEEAEEEDLLRKPTIEDSRVKVIKPRSHQHDETNGIDVLYANGRVFSSLNQNKGLTIFTTDRLGSVRFTTNSRGSNTDEYNYDAFGTSLGKKPELFGYNGKLYDAVTSNYDYGYRDYAPRQARFTTMDPIQDGSNWYVYCNNDPVNFTDPTGLETYVGRTPVVGYSSSQPSGSANTGWSVIAAYHTLTVITDKPITEPGAKVLATYEAGPDYSKNSTSSLGNLVQQKSWSTPDKVQADPGAYNLQKVALPSSYSSQSDFDKAIAAKAAQYNTQTPSPYQAVPEWASDPNSRNSNSYTGSLIRSVGGDYKPDYWAPGFQLNVPGITNPQTTPDSSKACGK